MYAPLVISHRVTLTSYVTAKVDMTSHPFFNPVDGSGPYLFQVTLSFDTVLCLLSVFYTEAMYDLLRQINRANFIKINDNAN